MLLASKIKDIAAKSPDGRVLHANAITGSGIQGQRAMWSEEAIWKHGGVTTKVRCGCIGSHQEPLYIEVVNKSYAEWKEVKTLLEAKSIDVRIAGRVERFVENLTKPRWESRRHERKRELTRTKRYREVADWISVKRTKVLLHMA